MAIHPKIFIEKKLGSRLSVQLMASFLGMFMIVVAVAFIALYLGIEDILAKNTERNSVQRFSQYEYNIDSFCNDIDLISRQLAMDSDLQSLTGYSDMSDSDRVYYSLLAIRQFDAILNNYTFIDSVFYYGSDGLIINTSANGNHIKYTGNTSDWFYQTSDYQMVKQKGRKLTWFGGYTDRDFSVSTNKPGAQPKFYISAAREALANGNSGALVLNIDMHYFTSIYNHSTDSNAGTIYLIDNSGKIISSLDDAVIGQKSIIYQGMSPDANIRNLTVTDGGRKEQVTYYRLSGLKSILVSEIPFSTINRDVTTLRGILITLFFVSLALAFFFSRYWIYRLLNPLKRLIGVIKKIGQGDLGLTTEETSSNEIGVLERQFNKMSTNIKELFDRNESIEAEKRNLEFDALRWQINPHFIYNTLNTIKLMAVINKADNIADSVTTLSDFLEPIFKSHDPFCTVSDELSYIRNYVKIMNYRYLGKFQCRIEVRDEYMQFRIIRFVLQPIVENALTHGLINCLKGVVTLTAWSEGTDFLLQVEDDGQGMSEAALEELRQSMAVASLSERAENHGIGLVNVNRRIKLQFGDKYGLTIESVENQGVKVRIKMPIVRKS